MRVIDLAEADADMIDLVGGKAAGLGTMIRAGERVPPGFCVTTEAHQSGEVPESELVAAYERLGGGPVAVRSSATAEDLPDASFAGQQETYLNVEGTQALVEAVRKCWESLETERATAYREARGFDAARMAVVVQRMVDPRAAGVLFTANPVTGSRAETVVDAAPGLGTSVVDGTVDPDRYVLDDQTPLPQGRGCLSAEELDELYQAGRRLADLFGSPQDAEWALDRRGTLWLLQSRPITTLFPLPPAAPDGQIRAFVEMGSKQGMLQPFTPAGMSLLRYALVLLGNALGLGIDHDTGPAVMKDVAGRPYLDVTEFLHDPSTRRRLSRSLGSYEYRLGKAVEYLLDDPRFAPRPSRSYPRGTMLGAVARHGPRFVVDGVDALVRPERARARAYRAAERSRAMSQPPARIADPAVRGLAAERMRFVREVLANVGREALLPSLAPALAPLAARALPKLLLRDIADASEIDAVLRGAPHNVTTDMDLELWRLADGADEHRELLLDTPPSELAARHLAGELPEFGLTAFLDSYGHRGAAEVDIGVPRWSEDPTPVFASIANYLRVSDPAQAPDRRFAEAAREAEALLADVARRGRRARPVRGLLAALLLRRARDLAGLRELPKFVELYPLAQIRRQLLAVGAELAAEGRLDGGDDIMFLSLAETEAAVAGTGDQRALVAQRRQVHERETRRSRVPSVLLSDGTEVETIVPRPPAPEGALTGVAAAPGGVRGRARVVLDPSRALLEPGEILVCPTTDPGWTPLFLTAGGLVSDTGSMVSHGPTVAREYGIPAVVGVQGATRRIVTGQWITVDGAAGTVTVETPEASEAVGDAEAAEHLA